MITLVMVLNEEYQGLVDNTADGNKAKKKKEVPSWGAGDEASSRPRAPQMREYESESDNSGTCIEEHLTE